MGDALLDIRGLSFTYDESPAPALDGVDLAVAEGQLVLLCGPTGCGKTSLALCINGLAPYATGGRVTGSVKVAEMEATETPTPHMATDVGLVFQDPEGQLCTLFLEDEIAFGPENLRVPQSELRERVRRLLALIGLAGAEQRSVFELSGGQKQKLNIASVLAMQPRLLVCDMPTANLDPAGSAEVFGMIRELATRGGVTCVIIENRLDDLAPLADRVLVMDRGGKLVYDGAPEEVFAQGRQIMDGLGVEIPQAVELALALCEQGHDLTRGGLPLTVDQVADRLAQGFASGELHVPPAEPAASTLTATTAPPAENVVEMRDVRFAYGRGPEILKGISFSMRRGELLAIVGNNGSGKTTLAKQLVGLLRPTAGEARVCGLDMRRARVEDVSARAAYVFQYPDHQFVAQGQTVSDEIAFNLRMAGRSEDEVTERVASLVRRFELNGKEGISPFLLSGGEMRTLSVACMLSTDPELLILDEPTYGQDRRRITALMERLAELRAGGTSVIMISHDMRLVAEYATSALLLSDGQLLFYGPPAELFGRQDLLARAALKEPPVAAVVRRLREQGVPLPATIVTVPAFLSALAAPAHAAL